MESTVDHILNALEDPERLEVLYRQDPSAFRNAFEEVLRAVPDSATLRVWRARLEYRDVSKVDRRRRLWHALAIGLTVGLIVRVPSSWMDAEWYYSRFAASLVILSLAVYFWLQTRSRSRLITGLSLAGVAAVYASLLPELTDSVTMALIHLPILFWGFLGFVFTGASAQEPDGRIRFIRYNGELLILASLVGFGGFVFSGITVALFQLLVNNVGEWYFQNIGVIGAAAVPVAATYLYDAVFKGKTGIAPVLSRVFAPLFLLMICTYLVFAGSRGQNPFVDRDFLITVNALLIVVLGMTLFSIAERGEDDEASRIMDYVNVALLSVTLIIDLIALSAILFRLASYGFTPNRVVVLGANLVAMSHLVWTCIAYVGLIRRKVGVVEVRRAVVGYLPVYIAWAAIVVFVLPLVFGYA